MAEVETKKPEGFNPELIKFENLEEAKLKYFETHKDLQKYKTEAGKIPELTSELEKMKKELEKIAKQRQDEDLTIQEKMKEDGKFKELYEKILVKSIELENSHKSLQEELAHYKEIEKKSLEREKQLKKEAFEKLMPFLSEDEKDEVKDYPLSVMQKLIKIHEKNPIDSQNQMVNNTIPKPDGKKLASELINPAPEDFFKQKIQGKYQ